VTAAILLAGGRGTRLESVSKGEPKPMISVAGRPFIEHILDRVLASCIDEVILSVGFRAEVFQAHFGSAYSGLPLRYAIESEPLGTGGALLRSFRQFDLPRAFVINADTLFAIDLDALLRSHVAASAKITIALCRMADTSRYGTVDCDAGGHITRFREKRPGAAGLINAGIYVAERTALERFALPEKFSFEKDLLERHVEELRPLGAVADAYFIDIGVPEDLERARRELATS